MTLQEMPRGNNKWASSPNEVICDEVLETGKEMGPLQLAVTCKIRHAGEQAVHWDIQNKATSSRQICIFFVLDVPVRSLLSSMVDFVPCDRYNQLQKY